MFSHFTNSISLPSVTLADRSKAVVKAVGTAKPLPSLPLDSVLYLPYCPFNLVFVSKLTRALNCSITFDDHSVTIQDRATGQMIGVGCESQGLYHLNPPASPVACSVIKSPAFLHNRLGHPSLAKF